MEEGKENYSGCSDYLYLTATFIIMLFSFPTDIAISVAFVLAFFAMLLIAIKENTSEIRDLLKENTKEDED